MRRTAVLALVSLLLGAGLVFVLWPRESEELRAVAPVAPDAPAPGAAEPSSTVLSPQGTGREGVGTRSEADVSSAADAGGEVARALPASEATEVRLRGRVLDVQGRPLGDVGVGTTRIAEHLRGALARSDGEGAFEIVGSRWTSERLVTRDDGYATLCQAVVDPGALDREHLIVAARTIDVAGLVTDAYGLPVAEVSLGLFVDNELLAGFPLALDATYPVDVQFSTDGEGRFASESLPAPEGAVLDLRKEGYCPAELAIPAVSRDDLNVVLERLAPPERLLVEGVVLFPDRSPAKAARVFLAGEEAEADEQGRFRFELPYEPLEEGAMLAAGLSGWSPALVADFDRVLSAHLPEPPPFQELWLGEDLAISGRLVDFEGQPLADWTVSFFDGTALTPHRVPPVLVEGLGAAKARVPTTRSDEDGRFRIAGLLPRDYVVHAWDRHTVRSVRSAPTPAGTTDLELRLPADDMYPRVAGRVVTRSGLPAVGVQVRVEIATYRTKSGYMSDTGATTQTADDGGFELLGVPREHAWLDLVGEDILPVEYPLERGAPVEELVISVAARCHFRVELEGAAEGLTLEMHDEAGEPLSIFRIQGGGWTSTSSAPLEHWVGILSTSEDARTWVLLEHRSRKERTRGPVGLVPGQVTPVRIESR